MADMTKRREQVAQRSRTAKANASKGNAGFFGIEAEPEEEVVEIETPTPAAPRIKSANGWNFTRGHVRMMALVLLIGFAAAVGFGYVNLVRMNEAAGAAHSYQTVNARVITAEKADSNSQKLQVLWGYDNNTKVTSTDVISLGSADKYHPEDMVSVMYKPSEFDQNTPKDGEGRFLSDQYEQANVLTYLPFIIAFGIVALVVLVGGIAILVFMNKNAAWKEKWG